MSLFANVKSKLEAFWHKIDGEARAELQQAVAEAETELAKVGPLLTKAEADIKEAVAAAQPAVQAAVTALLQKLLQDAGGLLGTDLADKPEPPAAA
jgi:F0F1-type ATP synthase membrane subunit b/b'